MMLIDAQNEQLRLGRAGAELRDALFIAGDERTWHDKLTLIAANPVYELRFMGETLNASDRALYEALLHRAVKTQHELRCDFSMASFLASLGRGTDAQERETLLDDITRLIGGVIEITDLRARRAYCVKLVTGFLHQGNSGRCVATLGPSLARLYQASERDEVHRTIGGNPHLRSSG